MIENWPRPTAVLPARGVLASLRRRLAPVLVVGALLGIVAGGPASDAYGSDDPLENFNRAMFEVNQTIDGVLWKPAAQFYTLVVPELMQRRVSNALDNLGEPLNLLNNLAQGKFERAGSTLMRFWINSTIGVAGAFDVATDWGYGRTPEDFGQTLASWGVGSGPFLMLPVLGPSNPRDAVGFGIDWVADPLGHILPPEAVTARSVTSAVALRAEHLDNMETLEKTSVDFYAALRELYRQYRDNEIRDGAPPSLFEVPRFDFNEDWLDG